MPSKKNKSYSNTRALSLPSTAQKFRYVSRNARALSLPTTAKKSRRKSQQKYADFLGPSDPFVDPLGPPLPLTPVEPSPVLPVQNIKQFVDLFSPFRPLMIPLSGVEKMVMLTRDEQKIFLIGEKHQFNFCKEKGYTPLAQIIEEYLKSRTEDEPVDFMLEMNASDGKVDDDMLEKSRQAVTAYKNPFNKRVGPRFSMLTLNRVIVDHLLPPNTGNPNSRVHWLDPLTGESTKVCKANSFEAALLGCLDVHEYTIEARFEVDQYLIENVDFTPKWSIQGLPESLTQPTQKLSGEFKKKRLTKLQQDSFFKSTEEDKINFVKACYEALRDSGFYKKCYENPQQVPWEIYKNVVVEFIRNENDIQLFYFRVQRFCMDIYTCCRIMKTDKESRWYKNIVIYAGLWHVRNYINILTALGYTRHELPEPIQFNPYCK